MQRGAKTRSESPVKYWTFSRGQFVRRVDESVKEATQRVLEKGPNKGKAIYEIFRDQITGRLVDCKVKDGEYGKSYQLIIDVSVEEPEFYAVDFKFNGSGKSLLKKLPNIDLHADIALVCYTIDDTNAKGEPVKNYYAVPYQGEISKAGKVQPAFTKDEPNGLPPMEKKKIKGKDVWDDTEQIEYLEDLIKATDFPGVPGESPEATAGETNQPPVEKVEEADPFEEPTDGVGF